MTHPTAPSYRRKISALVRFGPYAGPHAGKPRFEYDPRNMPIGLWEMLTPQEQAAVDTARNLIAALPAGSNVRDCRELLPDMLPEPARSALIALQTAFPLPGDVPGALAA